LEKSGFRSGGVPFIPFRGFFYFPEKTFIRTGEKRNPGLQTLQGLRFRPVLHGKTGFRPVLRDLSSLFRRAMMRISGNETGAPEGKTNCIQ
jgi:hypothetical protein